MKKNNLFNWISLKAILLLILTFHLGIHVNASPSNTNPKISVLQQKVSGTVRDANTGETLIGVNVYIEGTTIGTITDNEGNYSIQAKPGTVLVFSFLGYLTEKVIVASEQSIVDIKLITDIQNLEEVVVIGYGTAKKSDLTGAVSRANMSALGSAPNVNVLQALKGTVPGLNIGVATTAGADPAIDIRGKNSLAGTSSPLIVLDGIIYRGAFTDINPNDIQSIDVLKDASSAAIYGSQAANGVILITTKTASKNSKPVISYSGQYTTQSILNTKLKPLDRDGFLEQMENLFLFTDGTGSRLMPDLLQPNPAFDIKTKFKDQAATDGYLADTNTDWWGLLTNKNPHLQNHSLSITGRNDLASYFMSFGYTDQQNLVVNDDYKRYSFRLNLDTKITDWLKIGTQSYYNISDFSGNNIGFSSLVSIPALVTPYNADGSLKTSVYLGGINPLLTKNNPNLDKRNTLSGTFYTDISIPWIKGLSYRANYSRYHDDYKNYTFSPYDNNSTGGARKYHTNSDSYTFDNIVTYKRDFGKHSVNATLVYGVEEREYENTDANAQGFTDMSLGYNNIGAGIASLNKVSSDAWKETSLYSMARVVYSYKNRYMVTGTVRRDGFSGFTEQNKFATFPSIALGWIMSEESFIKNNFTWVDNLKLRVSYGQAGNRTAGRYSSLAQMTPNVSGSTVSGYLFGDGATGELGQGIRTIANLKLKWETTTSKNIGLDFSFLKGRIFGNYEFYYSKTTDLLYNVDYPRVIGSTTTSIATNIGALRNIGHELSITGVPIRTKDIEWTVIANFSTNDNKVITILGKDVNKDGIEDNLINGNPPLFPGKSYYSIFDYPVLGMYQLSDFQSGSIPNKFYAGTYKVDDVNGDGNYDNLDKSIVGFSDPLYRFNITNTIKYKNLELRAVINSIQGGKNHYLAKPAGDLPLADQLQNQSWLKFDYWTPENPNAKYRQLGQYGGGGLSVFPYVSRSFIRLQELSLGYNFSSKLLSKVKISKAKIYVTGTNLFTITKWDGWDPEAGQGLTYNINGYPTMKTYTVGVNLEF